jgi:predicted DsbA family dithiol-disulfide isomerase
LAEVPLKQATEGKDVQIEWMPFELHPAPTPTRKPEDSYLQTAWKERIYPMAERLGLHMKLPTVSPYPYTNLAFQGLEFAKDYHKGDAYNGVVFRAFFQQSRDIGQIDVLAHIAKEVGLDVPAFRDALETGAYREQVRQLLQTAYVHARVTAVPTMLVGRQRLEGLYPADTIRQAIESELAHKAAESQH